MGRSLLIIVAGLVAIFSVIQMNMQRKQVMALDRSYNYHRNLQARNIANSLMEEALQKIEDDFQWRDGIIAADYLSGSGTVDVYDAESDSTLDENELHIVSRGHLDNVTKEVEVRMHRTSFSKYSYFTNVEPGIYFITGDTIMGPSHTNGPFHYWGNPVFTGKVTSPHMWRGSGDPQFLDGFDFSSDFVTLPTDLTPLRNAAETGGLVLANTSKVVFNADGTVDISYEIGHGSWSQPENYNLADYNGVISSSRDVYVKGELNGAVTLHSTRNIHIIGDVDYTDNPIQNPASEDILGIIAEHRIIVDDGAERDHGDQDLHIDASMMALGNSFTVEHFGVGNPRGRLWILGGVIQDTRGAVGTFSHDHDGTRIRSGYKKSYKYDERLRTKWPPYYPVQMSYSVISWRDE